MNEEIDEKEKRQYELSFLLKEEDVSLPRNILMRHGTTVLNEGRVSKFRLSYPINKETQAYFSYFQFEAEPLAIEKISNDLKLEAANILRYLIVSSPAVKKGAEKPVYVSPSPEPRHRETELTNEELEKKIEEIKI